MESLFVEIEFENNKKVIIGNVYAPPNLNLEQSAIFLNTMQKILELVEQNDSSCVIVGDFNLCLLKHNSHRPTEDFIDTMFSFGHLQLLKNPSRIFHYAAHTVCL